MQAVLKDLVHRQAQVEVRGRLCLQTRNTCRAGCPPATRSDSSNPCQLTTPDTNCCLLPCFLRYMQGKGVVGRTGREQVAAAYAVYGPRTVLVWARPGISNSSSPVVQQFVLSPKGVWQMVPQAPVAGAQQPAGASCSADGSSQGAAAGGAQQEGPSSSGRCDAPTSTTQQQQPLIGQGKRLFAPANLRW
jgi:hypothetical protein